MKVRKIDSNGDWTFGNANYAKNNEAIAQNVETRLRLFRGDWFLDEVEGINWFNILGQKDNEAKVLEEVRRITLATDGVTKITDISIIAITNRDLKIAINFDTIYKLNNDLGVTI